MDIEMLMLNFLFQTKFTQSRTPTDQLSSFYQNGSLYQAHLHKLVIVGNGLPTQITCRYNDLLAKRVSTSKLITKNLFIAQNIFSLPTRLHTRNTNLRLICVPYWFAQIYLVEMNSQILCVFLREIILVSINDQILTMGPKLHNLESWTTQQSQRARM
jgi:hypothetical protein